MAKRSNYVVGIPSTDWELEEDLRCFMRVCKLQKDPKRMKQLTALAKQKLEEAAAVAAETSKGGY